MLISILFALVFIWLILRELLVAIKQPKRFSLAYFAMLCALLALCLWVPVKYWRLEQFLAEKASELADSRPVDFHCNTAIDAMFDNRLNVIGHANPETGEIVFQVEWCKHLMEYMDHPEELTQDELMSLALFTHEAMHIRGELNERKTECQAIQRNYRAAKLLGTPEALARKNANAYYRQIYPKHPYFSPQCIPGGVYDERLADSSWRYLKG